MTANVNRLRQNSGVAPARQAERRGEETRGRAGSDRLGKLRGEEQGRGGRSLLCGHLLSISDWTLCTSSRAIFRMCWTSWRSAISVECAHLYDLGGGFVRRFKIFQSVCMNALAYGITPAELICGHRVALNRLHVHVFPDSISGSLRATGELISAPETYPNRG